MDLEEAADLLYALPSAQFTARRGELAGQARKAGEPAVAKQIAELRRPTVSAGLINRLVRAEQDDPDSDNGPDSADVPDGRDDTSGEGSGEAGLVDRIRTLGDELRQAQAELDGPAMKELTPQRHELVAALVRRAFELVDDGQKVSGSVQRELEETFAAAVADEQAALAVTSGRLTRALVYSGFGDVDVTAATATPLNRSSGSPRGSQGAGGGDRHLSAVADSKTATRSKAAGGSRAATGSTAATGSKAGTGSRTGSGSKAAVSPAEAEAQAAAEAEAEAERLRATADSARAMLRECQEQLAVSTARQQEVHAEEENLAARLDELQREILQTRHELDSVSRQVAAADRDHVRQERQTRDARKAVDRAQQAIDRLTKAD